MQAFKSCSGLHLRIQPPSTNRFVQAHAEEGSLIVLPYDELYNISWYKRGQFLRQSRVRVQQLHLFPAKECDYYNQWVTIIGVHQKR